MSAKYGIRARLLAMPVIAFEAVISRLPLVPSLHLGTALGWAAGWLVPIRRRVIDENIARAFPEMTPRERARLRRRFWAHFGCFVVSTIHLANPRRMVQFRFAQVEGMEHLERLAADGKGVIAVTGHLGSWELLGGFIAHRGFPGAAIAQPIHNGFIHDRIVRTREALGIQLLFTGRRINDEIVRRLRAGEVVGFLADVNARQHGTFVDFFGQPASTPRGPAMFALRTGAPILPAFCIHLGGRDHRIVFGEPIPPPENPPDTDRAVQELTQRHTRALEEMIRRHPEQYFWFHRRWKTRPEQIRAKRRQRAGLGSTPIAD